MWGSPWQVEHVAGRQLGLEHGCPELFTRQLVSILGPRPHGRPDPPRLAPVELDDEDLERIDVGPEAARAAGREEYERVRRATEGHRERSAGAAKGGYELRQRVPRDRRAGLEFGQQGARLDNIRHRPTLDPCPTGVLALGDGPPVAGDTDVRR